MKTLDQNKDNSINNLISKLNPLIEDYNERKGYSKPEPSLRDKLAEKFIKELPRTFDHTSNFNNTLVSIAADFFLENLPGSLFWEHDKEAKLVAEGHNTVLKELRKAWEK